MKYYFCATALQGDRSRLSSSSNGNKSITPFTNSSVVSPKKLHPKARLLNRVESTGETDDLKNILVIDTSVLVHDPECLKVLLKDNLLVIPWIVLEELDQLKHKPDIEWDAREVIRRIEELAQNDEKSLRIEPKPGGKYFKNSLQKDKADHQIIATALAIEAGRPQGTNVTLMSRDAILRVLARKIGVVSQDYPFTQTNASFQACLKRINVPQEVLDPHSESFECDVSDLDNINLNEGVVCWSSTGSIWEEAFVAINKGTRFKKVPDNIEAAGLRPYYVEANGTQNGRNKHFPRKVGKNWSQHVALAHVLDPEIKLVFLQGGAGTGKTLIALAGAIEQRKAYTNIIIARPMVHLDDRDEIGYLPGSLEQKMAPWIEPILQSFSFLSGIRPENNTLISKLQETKKIIIKPLDYIRGETYHKCFIVIDEAQNLTPHQMKTIITRAGLNTKLVFTGDLDQIDRKRRLDRKTSGLAYAMSKLSNQPMVAIVNFKDTVRSPLASLAAELL